MRDVPVSSTPSPDPLSSVLVNVLHALGSQRVSLLDLVELLLDHATGSVPIKYLLPYRTSPTSFNVFALSSLRLMLLFAFSAYASLTCQI